MSATFRALMLGSAMAGLAACASNPPTPPRAPIDYRTVNPAARGAAKPPPARTATRPLTAPTPAPPPRIVDVGISPTATSAIDEAKALAPQAGIRPGGALLQPKDNPRSRAVSVLPGDTVYDISRRYSVNMRALIEANRLEPPYALNSGSVIYLPTPNIHKVQRGETLYSVSRRYNVDTRSLALLNSMSRPWAIWPGDELLLPPLARDQGRATVVSAVEPQPRPPARTPSAPTIKPAAPSVVVAANDPPVALKPSVKLPPKKAAIGAEKPKRAVESADGDGDFIWPVSGSVLKGFGTGEDGLRNDGVNISAPAGAKVKASASGEVVYAGNELAGFGNLVLIRHPGGWVSAYAHAETLLVKEGDQVVQGQPVAEAGATGNADGPQVHFELRKGKEPVNPADHLPALRG